MYEVIQNGSEDMEFWKQACLKIKTEKEWAEFFDHRGYRGAVDFPTALFYK